LIRPASHQPFDPIGCERDGFVFPNAYHDPADFMQTPVGVMVARDVRFDFGAPPVGIIFWPCTVLGTPMPKASIDKYRNAGCGKDDVHCTATTRQEFLMDTKPKAAAVDFRSQFALKPIVALCRVGHPLGRFNCDRFA
jgi:hypothetical protein